jgi:hypothetical protein
MAKTAGTIGGVVVAGAGAAGLGATLSVAQAKVTR